MIRRAATLEERKFPSHYFLNPNEIGAVDNHVRIYNVEPQDRASCPSLRPTDASWMEFRAPWNAYKKTIDVWVDYEVVAKATASGA